MKGRDLELKRHPNRPLSHARVIYRRGTPPRRRTEDTPDRTRSHGLPQPNNTREGRTDGWSDSPGTCSSERGGPRGPGGRPGPARGTPALRLKHAAARPQVPPAPPGGLGAAPGTQTGKLMQGLVPQRAVPSPHTEYLGITYCEGSNADRSSALGLRLNQQDKNEEKQKTYPVISTMSRIIVPFAKCFQDRA